MNAAKLPMSAHFRELYRHADDPWQVRQRWYEQRKRALLLACLPQQRYLNGYEPGCGNGVLTVGLAARCERLLASDGAAEAVALTRRQLDAAGRAAHVTLLRQQLPRDWAQPGDQHFDLIVISEWAYYLDVAALAELVQRSVQSLAVGGSIVLCHWRAPFADRVQATATVHDAFGAAPTLHRLLRHEEQDFLLDVYSNLAHSVAQREGLQT